MSFLDGIDLSGAAERQLRRDLELRLHRVSQSNRFSHWHNGGTSYAYVGGGAELCLRHGRFWSGRPIPERYAHLRGAESRCFANALSAAEAMPELTYCEGYYTTGFGGPRTHGWCIAPDGGVVEVTMPTAPEELSQHVATTGLPFLPPERWGYYGVTFVTSLVREHLETLGLPMLDRPRAEVAARGGLDYTELHDFPLLKLLYDPNRSTLS